MSEVLTEQELKMRDLLKSFGMWWKEGDKVVLSSQYDSNVIGVIDFIHSDDTISVNFDGQFAIYFPDNIRRPHKFELERGARFWRDSPSFHYTDGSAEFDD